MRQVDSYQDPATNREHPSQAEEECSPALPLEEFPPRPEPSLLSNRANRLEGPEQLRTHQPWLQHFLEARHLILPNQLGAKNLELVPGFEKRGPALPPGRRTERQVAEANLVSTTKAKLRWHR